MDAFLTVAGVVGFVASQDSLINLMDRVGRLVSAHPTEYTDSERFKFELCKHKFHDSLQKMGAPAEGDVLPNLYIKSVMSKMDEISRLKDHPSASNTSKTVTDLLDDTEKLIESMSSWKSTTAGSSPPPFSSSSAHHILEAETQNMKLLISLMRPANKQLLRKKELKEKHVLLETRDDMELQRALDGLKKEDEDADLSTIHWKANNYIVERVEFGTNPREKEKRLSRLGRLILNMREWDDPCVTKMAFVAEGQDRFYIFSELEGSFTFLDKALKCVDSQSQASLSGTSSSQKAVNKICLLVQIALAIKKLHDQMILHEGIGSHNVLVGDVMANAVEVKLVGFVSARMVDDLSDRPSPLLSPKVGRRRIVYQAPWRIAGSRYSFECDVYSLGVVMAELQCGCSFVDHPAIQGRDDILAVLMHENPPMVDLIHESMSTQASLVPSISEVLQRLNCMLPP